METIFQIATVIVAIYILTEAAAAVYIYRNRAVLVPRIRVALRNLLGLDTDANSVETKSILRNAEYRDLDRKITYIGRHIKFERDQLRKMGVLKSPQKSDNSTLQNVIPLRPNN